MLVGVVADERLKQRAGDLEGQGDDADPHEVEGVGFLDDRIDGGDQGLDQVVEKMRRPKDEQHRDVRSRDGRWVGRGNGHFHVRFCS